MKLHSVTIAPRRSGSVVLAITAHKQPRLFALGHRFERAGHAERMAAKVKAAGAIDPKHWVEVDPAPFMADGSLRTRAA